MAAIYVRWIKAGRMTIDDVPERWREEVQNRLGLEPESNKEGQAPES